MKMVARCAKFFAVMVLALSLRGFDAGIACANAGGCTLYVYACGSDLEEREGLVSSNLAEMLEDDLPDNVRVVVQTGGSTHWWNHDISSEHLQRYEVRDHKLVLVQDLNDQSMGDADVLQDFLSWGAKRYWSERNVLILIDHGSTSGDRLCYDNNWDEDALTRDELARALKEAKLPAKYDLVAFDACFMACVENALALASHADYVLASQEEIPSVGLDYAQLVSDLATTDVRTAGTNACEAFVQKCDLVGKSEVAGLSLLDLSEAQEFADVLDEFLGRLATVWKSRVEAVGAIHGGARAAAVYVDSSTTNLMDVRCFVDAMEAVGVRGAKRVLAAYDRFVACNRGGTRCQSTGASLYYPFAAGVQGSEEYMRACPLKGYRKLLKLVYDASQDVKLTLADRGSTKEDGTFCVSLRKGREASFVRAYYTLLRYDASTKRYVRVGQSFDVKQAANGRTFEVTFPCAWPTIAGQPLLTTAFQAMPHVAVYTARAVSDHAKASIFLVYNYDVTYGDGSYVRAGLMGGLQPFDIQASRYDAFVPGKEVVTFEAHNLQGNNAMRREAVVVPNDIGANGEQLIRSERLEDGKYACWITIEDVWGRKVHSDYAMAEVAGGQAHVTEVRSGS